MARKAKERKPETTIQWTTGELQRLFEDVATMKTKAKQHAGDAGAEIKHFCEKTGYSRRSVNFVAALVAMDELKSDNILDEVIVLYEATRQKAQAEMFERAAARRSRDVRDESTPIGPAAKPTMPLDEFEAKLAENNQAAEDKPKRGRPKLVRNEPEADEPNRETPATRYAPDFEDEDDEHENAAMLPH